MTVEPEDEIGGIKSFVAIETKKGSEMGMATVLKQGIVEALALANC